MFDKIVKQNLSEKDKEELLKPFSNEIKWSTLISKGYPSYFLQNNNKIGSHKGQNEA